jgi:2-hydroxychromene-2-carboxylate isomerase
MKTLEVWFEFASTYSYPAISRVETVARAAGVGIAWRPFLLGPVFRNQGWNDSPFNVYPVKGRYMWRDLERICADLGLPLVRPSQFPRPSLIGARVACTFQDEPWAGEFIRRVYRANFAEDRDIGDATVIASILESVGQPAARLEAAQSAEAKTKLREQSDAAIAHDIFGAPSFRTAGELFWGNDRLDSAVAWAAAH